MDSLLRPGNARGHGKLYGDHFRQADRIAPHPQPNHRRRAQPRVYEQVRTTAAARGLLVINSTLIQQQVTRTDIESITVPANELAAKLGNVKMANVVVVGAMLAKEPIVSLEAVDAVLDEHLAESKQRFVEPNKQALREGAAYIREHMNV